MTFYFEDSKKLFFAEYMKINQSGHLQLLLLNTTDKIETKTIST